MPSDNKNLAGKVAWITGGGSGIGLAAGLELARAGAHVVLSGRSAETLKKAQKEVGAETLVLDVADRKQVAAAAQKILKQHGSIDIALGKAVTANNLKRPTKAFQDLIAQGGGNLRLLAAPGVTPLEGGVPIIVDGKIIGAIGVSGVLSNQDAEVAMAGAAAAK